MKLNGTARGRNMAELLAEANRQAHLFYGNTSYGLKVGTPRADTEYEHFTDGSFAPIRTSFDMDFTAESTGIIQEGQ